VFWPMRRIDESYSGSVLAATRGGTPWVLRPAPPTGLEPGPRD
jgi:hypothetical protein